MKRTFYFLFLLFNFVFAEEPEDFKWATTPDGRLFTIFIDVDDDDQKEHVCVLEMYEEDEINKMVFHHRDGVYIASPNIAVNSLGQAIASWIEYNCISSCCCVSLYDGEWGAVERISTNTFRVHANTPPALTMDSEYIASVAFIAYNVEGEAHIQLNHLNEDGWIGSQSIYITQDILSNICFVADSFGKKVISWINNTNQSIQVLEKLKTEWKITFTNRCAADYPLCLSMAPDGSLMLAWVNIDGSIQTASYDDAWHLLDPFKTEKKLFRFTLSYGEIGFILLWSVDIETPQINMALFDGMNWDIIDLVDFMDINPFNDDDYHL